MKSGHYLAVECIFLPLSFHCNCEEQSSHYLLVNHLIENMDTFIGRFLIQHVQEL